MQADCTAACTLTARLELARKDARKLKLTPVVATGKAALLGAGRTTVRLRFTPKAAKKLRKVRKLIGTLTTQARDGTGKLAAQRTTKLTLKR